MRRKRKINTYEAKYKIIKSKRNICKDKKERKFINLVTLTTHTWNRLIEIDSIVKQNFITDYKDYGK